MRPIPTINVALTPSTWSPVHGAQYTPVPIPCPIPPSVTFTVRLGECGLRCTPIHTKDGSTATAHAVDCPARPIRVSCSISGKTWEESDVLEVEVVGRGGMTDAHVNVCRDRWALIKALVTGQVHTLTIRFKTWAQLVDQRNAVFAALAEQAHVEQAAFEAQERSTKALGEPTFLPDNFHRAEPERRPAAGLLERYVARLIEQVGILEGGQ